MNRAKNIVFIVYRSGTPYTLQVGICILCTTHWSGYQSNRVCAHVVPCYKFRPFVFHAASQKLQRHVTKNKMYSELFFVKKKILLFTRLIFVCGCAGFSGRKTEDNGKITFVPNNTRDINVYFSHIPTRAKLPSTGC